MDPRTVRRWVAAGLPTAGRGKAGHRAPRFDRTTVAAWLEVNAGKERSLVAALCSKLDAQSRATVRTLERLEAAHHPIENCLRERDESVQILRDRMEAVVRTLSGEFGPEVGALVAAQLREALAPLPPPAVAVGESIPWPPPRRQVKASSTVREARAQLSTLQAEVLDVRERIAAGKEQERCR